MSPALLLFHLYVNEQLSICDICTAAAGRVCPAGTDSEKGPKCPPGFYSSVGALTDSSECTPCTTAQLQSADKF